MLDIQNLHVEVDGKPILNGLDLHVNEGETHAIFGQNGSGKTTLVLTIMGFPLSCHGRAHPFQKEGYHPSARIRAGASWYRDLISTPTGHSRGEAQGFGRYSRTT